METTKAPCAQDTRALPSRLQPHTPTATREISATPCLPEVPAQFAFRAPEKRITSHQELQQFLESDTARSFLGFILALNEAVSGHKPGQPQELSAPVAALVQVLDTLWKWVDEIPPVQQSLRYGNPAFKTWFAKVEDSVQELLKPLLPEQLQAGLVEIGPFFVHSFGNSTRIDYGTGHETTFCAFLYCLTRMGVFDQHDCASLVNAVFNRYLELMRKVQTTYWLEPAGSHGVWGLDDYQFLSFIWGAAQLRGHPMIKPKSIHNRDVMESYAKDYMYLTCVRFVQQVKKGPLSETSPMLNDISGVPAWAKVNSGLIKMYQVEVMSKLPIMQHFLFGSLLSSPV